MKISQEAAIASSIGITASSLTSVYSASKFFTKNPRLSLIAWGALGMTGVAGVVCNYSAQKLCNPNTTLSDYFVYVVTEGTNLISKTTSTVLPSIQQEAVTDTLNNLNAKVKDLLNPPKNS